MGVAEEDFEGAFGFGHFLPRRVTKEHEGFGDASPTLRLYNYGVSFPYLAMCPRRHWSGACTMREQGPGPRPTRG